MGSERSYPSTAGPGPGSSGDAVTMEDCFVPRASVVTSLKRGFRVVAQFVAVFLQRLILCLEHAIELLGCEPDRRWETALILHAWRGDTANVDSICKRAKRLADKGLTEDALSLYIKVLEIEPENTTMMDIAAELLAELGDADGARELIARSIELQPARGYEKFVLLGHLETGADAICAFERGLELLKGEASVLEDAKSDGSKTGKEAADRIPDLRRKMAAVLVAMAKVFLTDCFEQPKAKETCEALLDRALLYDSENPEACQALADLRLSQGRRGEALLLVRRTTEICDTLPDGLIPTYDFRMVTARLLVELSRYKDATAVLQELSIEDEEDTEMWYLLGMCQLLQHQPKACRKSLCKAKELLLDGSGAGTGAGAAAGGDMALLDQIEALLQRRTISENEKERFWNPRWWVTAGGHATDQIETTAANKASPETLVALSASLPKGRSSANVKAGIVRAPSLPV